MQPKRIRTRADRRGTVLLLLASVIAALSVSGCGGNALESITTPPPSIDATAEQLPEGFEADAMARATNTMATFLNARMGGDLEKLEGHATVGMRKRQPELFKVQVGAFKKYEIVRKRQEDDSFVFQVRETWNGEQRMEEYVIVREFGRELVNEQR